MTSSTDASATATLTGSMLIGSQDVHGEQGTVFGVNPRTGQSLEPAYGLGGAAEVARATRLAKEAFGVYRATSLEKRAAFLDTAAGNIDALGDVLVERVVAESGIPEARVRGELARTVNQLRLFATTVRAGDWLGVRLDTPNADRVPLPKPDLRQRKVPLGPVAVFAASNFPLAFSVAGGDTASALAAGAPVVVKAHSSHPGTSELVGRAIRAAVAEHGLPEGTFSLLFGAGRELGTALVQDPAIAAVGFTGSRSGGLALVAAAAQRAVPIPVYAEMSSVNPVVLLPGALAERGADLGREFIVSVTTGAGQLCTSPGLVFAVAGEGEDTGFDEFVAAARAAVGLAPAAPMLTTGIQQAYQQGVEQLAARPGVTEVASGPTDEEIAACGQVGLYTTDGATFLADESLRDEIFGATSLIVRVRDLDQLHEILTSLEGQLTATVHAQESDHPVVADLLPVLEVLAGRVLFGGWPTGVEVGNAVVHGGPFPATSAPATTSVGTLAIERFLRPVSYQNVPDALLPVELRRENTLGLWRRIDGELGRD
ncbi:aldehyde dehydrogenase (NADP(+)) [Actinoalloteichus hymeniacidonis]|uniref:NAD-dependent aldehyde dehydrogenase n=1 Tax=Actinoalloteichus hymeniacidonis TaxID=340345 RepID=A0AAC9HS96_9PSEU|nr:aldehyde dehydrogenase (NADP(+)) [Actinoalloteichus hymeniacidonis]AOS64722.1 NAD-dependent aldehyde dehydrogenase [Actinoalloteichus hymeniacidonis]MBB5907202.1 NADP-dependent aldehyde dehydrogenase [Actinoalloteichus hymeniacidonis]